MGRGDIIQKICMFCGGKADLIEDISILGDWAVEVIVKCPVCHTDFRAIFHKDKWAKVKKAHFIAQLGRGP